MDFETVVKRRRMCREYLDRDVPQENVDRILNLACRYPSAGHTEPQEFIVVRDQRVKVDLGRAALDQMSSSQKRDEDIVARVSMGRFATPDDVAQAVAFLADPEQSGFVNGHTLSVDGDGSWESLRRRKQGL